MKCLNRCLALFLCIIMILSVPNTVFAVNSTTDSEDVQIYSVPIISNEYDGSHVTFYGIDGKYYLSFDDIKELARFELEETDTTITLTQGLRELVIEKSSGHLVDCDFVDQGNIDIIQYNGKYLCEGIPMLMYLGAACALKENQVLEVMMPTITIWESIMPDYLDYYFNITELYGGEDNVKISLACDIIADVLDGVSGHGLFANGDTHLEDALYEILNVDMMKYESVQESITAQNQSVNEFLASEGLSTFLDGSSSGIDSVSESLDYYADFYLDGEILQNEIRWQRIYSAGDLDTASSLSKEINQQVYEQSAIKANLANADNIGDALDLGMIALDTAITSYNLMQYDDDTKNLFSRTINEEIFRYVGYNNISWNNITDKISKNLSSNESIVQSAAIDSIVDYVSEEVTEKGVQTALSAFTSKANIYVAATQLATFLASLINYNTNQAFSADMNAIWLSTVQYDIAQLTSRMLVKERDEYHFSDAESLTKLKDMFTLYYRTIIAFSENITKSIEEFGGKSRNEWMQYFGGTSGKSVCNYAAIYLYRITNCTVVPIGEYSDLSDNLLKSEWIEQFKNRALSETELLAIMESSSKHKIENYIYTDMDHDGTNELIGVYSNETGLYQTWYCSGDGKTCVLVHQNNDGMDACEIELLNIGNETHVVLNAYRMMGTGKNYSIIALRNKEIICLISNKYGYVSMSDGGDITLDVEAYDGMYDPSIGGLILHTWKDTYLFFDGDTYKEYGASEISEQEFLEYQNSQEIKNKIESELRQSNTLSLEFTYFKRKNGIIHIQCNVYGDSGEIQYGYYTVRYEGNKLNNNLGEYTFDFIFYFL